MHACNRTLSRQDLGLGGSRRTKEAKAREDTELPDLPEHAKIR
jgi:hypothetical protein